MKRLISLLAMTSAMYCATAKTTVYCEIVNRRDGPIQITYVDFGDNRGNPPSGILVDKNGNEVKLEGKVDALNKMTRLGWKLEDTYIGKSDDSTCCYMLLSKEMEDSEPIERYVPKKKFLKLRK